MDLMGFTLHKFWGFVYYADVAMFAVDYNATMMRANKSFEIAGSFNGKNVTLWTLQKERSKNKNFLRNTYLRLKINFVLLLIYRYNKYRFEFITFTPRKKSSLCCKMILPDISDKYTCLEAVPYIIYWWNMDFDTV